MLRSSHRLVFWSRLARGPLLEHGKPFIIVSASDIGTQATVLISRINIITDISVPDSTYTMEYPLPHMYLTMTLVVNDVCMLA